LVTHNGMGTMEFKKRTLMQIADMICGNFNNARQFQQCQE